MATGALVGDGDMEGRFNREPSFRRGKTSRR
jgi:hypothetical protein